MGKTTLVQKIIEWVRTLNIVRICLAKQALIKLKYDLMVTGGNPPAIVQKGQILKIFVESAMVEAVKPPVNLKKLQ